MFFGLLFTLAFVFLFIRWTQKAAVKNATRVDESILVKVTESTSGDTHGD